MSQHPRRKLAHGKPRKGECDKPASPKGVEPEASNRLLAGYLAHEFLTNGTLLGRKFQPGSGLDGPSSAEPRACGSYKEVASILKTDGTHIKGIVNPTQLSNWINNS